MLHAITCEYEYSCKFVADQLHHGLLHGDTDTDLSSEALWAQLRFEAREASRDEPALSSYLDAAARLY